MTRNVSKQTMASGARSATTSVIQAAPSAVTNSRLAARSPKASKNAPTGVFGAALGGPDHFPRDVVADHRQVAVAFLVLHLVDRDGDEPFEQVEPAEGFAGDPHVHVVDCPPRHPVAVRRGLLVAHDRVMHDEVLERPAERRVMAGPRHLSHGRAARPAADPAGHRHQRNGGEPGVEMPPRPHAIAVIEPGDQLAATAATAPTPHLRTHMDSQPWPTLGLHLDGHDHDLTAQPEDRSKYLANAHAVPSTSTDLVPRQPTFALFDERWFRPGARGTSSAIVMCA
jgi:hypothetical protein